MKNKNWREERIEKLLNELRYEIERGLHERELNESMGFIFYYPLSRSIPDGVVMGEFRLRPLPRYGMHPDHIQPRLRVIK